MNFDEIIEALEKENGGFVSSVDDYGVGFQDGMTRAIQVVEELQRIYGDY